MVNTAELVNDVSNEKKFYKSVVGPLQLVRNGVGDGLFTVRCIALTSRSILTRRVGTQRGAQLGHRAYAHPLYFGLLNLMYACRPPAHARVWHCVDP